MDNLFQLQDERKLSYAFYGPIDGQVIFYLHGTPSSRLEPLLLKNYNKDINKLLEQYQLRLIAVDRPGMGFSTYNPKGSFTSFAEDVKQLADHLQISACKLLCWSGGGPYALALAYHFPQLIHSVYIVTGFSRSFSEPNVFKNMNGNVYYFGAARYVSWLMKPIMNYVGRHEADKPIPQKISRLPDVDHKLLADPEVINHFTKVTLNEACRFGSNGLVHEAALYFNETGYTLSKINQPVHYWWGTKDNTVTKVHAEAVEQQVPNSVMYYKPNEGHLSVYVNCFEEVLETITMI